jgi:hypothetical protein
MVSGCINLEEVEGEPKDISKNGIKMKIPSEWIEVRSDANDSLLAVANPNYGDSLSHINQVSVVVQKEKLSSSLNSMFRSNYDTIFSDSSYNEISEGNTSIGSLNGLECIYTFDDGLQIKQQRAFWVEKANNVYVILCTAPVNEFDNQQKYFDFILQNTKLL